LKKQFSPRILHPAKLTFKIDRRIKVFHNKQKLKQYMTTKPPLQKTLQGILHREDENKQSHERKGSIKPQERYSETSIESAAYTEILKQQKQINGRNHQIPLNINTEC
jgi:hypothetical protein